MFCDAYNTMLIIVHIKNYTMQHPIITKCTNLCFHRFTIIPYQIIFSAYINANKYINFVSNSTFLPFIYLQFYNKNVKGVNTLSTFDTIVFYSEYCPFYIYYIF